MKSILGEVVAGALLFVLCGGAGIMLLFGADISEIDQNALVVVAIVSGLGAYYLWFSPAYWDDIFLSKKQIWDSLRKKYHSQMIWSLRIATLSCLLATMIFSPDFFISGFYFLGVLSLMTTAMIIFGILEIYKLVIAEPELLIDRDDSIVCEVLPDIAYLEDMVAEFLHRHEQYLRSSSGPGFDMGLFQKAKKINKLMKELFDKASVRALLLSVASINENEKKLIAVAESGKIRDCNTELKNVREDVLDLFMELQILHQLAAKFASACRKSNLTI